MTRKAWRDTDITAYLDGELPSEKRVAFEATLAQNDTLRQQVAAQRQTIDFVQSVAQRTPPRNYLLTPSMVTESKTVSRSKSSKSLMMMRLATSLAAVVFVLSIGLNVLNPVTQRNALIMPAQEVAEDGAGGMFAEPADDADVFSEPSQEKAVIELESAMSEPASEHVEPQRAVPTPMSATEPVLSEGVGAGELPMSDEPIKGEHVEMMAVTEDAGTFVNDTMTNTMAPAPKMIDLTEEVSSTDAFPVLADPVSDTNGDAWVSSTDDVERQPVSMHPLSYVIWGAGLLTMILAGFTIWLSRRSK